MRFILPQFKKHEEKNLEKFLEYETWKEKGKKVDGKVISKISNSGIKKWLEEFKNC